MSTPAVPVTSTPSADEIQGRAAQPSGSIAYALLRFRGLVGAVTLLGALLGLVVGVMQPNSFTSSGTLLLRSGARETATAESTVAGRESQDARPFDFIANEIQILSHRDAFHRVVEKVGVDRLLEAYEPSADDNAETSVLAHALHRLQTWWFACSEEERAASPAKREFLALKKLLTDLSLRAAGSSVIRVSCEAHTAELAKEIVDAFLAAAEEHHRQVFSNRTSFEFLTVVEKQSRAAAEAATDQLLEFKHQHGIFDLGAQRTAIIADIDKLETQLAADEQQLQAYESRCESERRLLASELPLAEVVTDGPPLENPEHAALQEQIFTLRSQEATTRGGLDKSETEHKVKALADYIANLERRLETVPPMLPGARTREMVKNARHERLRGLLDDDELKVVELRVNRDRQAARLEKLRARVQGLDEIGPCYDSLVDEVQKHEGDSKRFLESLKKAELLNLLDENKLSNLRILEAGDLPVQKSGPNRVLRTLLGAAFGLLIAVCVALLRQRSDGSVRRAEDLESAGAEVLGVVPETRALAAQEPHQDAGPDQPRERALRRRLDGLWSGVLPACIPRDFRCTIAMVGDEQSPGVTTLALHCATRAASCHHLDVLLIEANYHHPTLAARHGLVGTPGLADLLGGTASRAEVVLPTKVPGLSIVHAGVRDPARNGMRPTQAPEDLLRSLSDGFHVVVLDLPSIVDHPEFRQLAWCADVVVPVFAAGGSTKDGVRGLMHAIASAGKRTPGAILNRWRSIRPFWLPKYLDF